MKKTDSGRVKRILGDIIQMQQRIISTDDPQAAFRLFLQSMLDLTASDYGFISEIFDQDSEKPLSKTHAIVDVSTNRSDGPAVGDDIPPPGDARDFIGLFGHALTSGEVVTPDMPDEQIEKHWLPEGHPKVDSFIGVPLRAGDSLVGVVGLANRKDGFDEVDLSDTQPLRDFAAHMLVVTRERNLHRQQEQQHANFQKISRAVLMTALDGIIGMDEKGDIAEFNPAAEAIFGWSRSEVIGRKLADVVIPEQLRSAHNNGLDHFLETGEGPVLGKRIEVTAIRKSGEEFPVELAVVGHEVRGEFFFTAHTRDISERRKSEEELGKARELAESASRAKSSFVATISHEIRTPINAIMGALGLLSNAKVDATSQHLLEIAQTSAKALLGLVDGVLDFSRIETGAVTLETEQITTESFLDEVLNLLSGVAEEGKVQLGCVCHSGVPSRLRLDVGKVRQILLNLAGNAIKFSPAGEVRLDLEVEDSGLRFTVSDSGVGISKNDCASIFDEFSQFGNARDLGGAGLGLAICKRLVDLLGGEIGVESRVGRGSDFWFTLPYDLTQSVSGPRAGKVYRKVLVIGDGGFYEEVLREQLRAWNIGQWAASEFSDAQDTLSHSGDIDAVCLVSCDTDADPWIDGALRLTNQCRESGLPVILITEVGEEDTKDLERKLGLTCAIRAPISLIALRKSLQRTADGRAEKIVPVALSSEDVSSQTKIRVLLAEDSHSNRLVMAEVLRGCGFEVDTAGNGAEALAAVSSFPYHVVLMDIDMPEMNGIEATHAIRLLDGAVSEVPIIAVTAHASAQDEERFLSEGMSDYICKPVDRDILGAKIRKWARGPLDLDVPAPESLQSRDAEQNNAQLVDERALGQLADDTSPDLVPKMVAVFVRELRLRAMTINDAIANGDIKILRTEAHALKSSAATYGAAAVRAQALLIEEGSDANDDGRVIAAARGLVELVEPTAQSLEGRFPGE